MSKITITKNEINSFALEAASRTKTWKKDVIIYLIECKKLGLYRGNISEELIRLSRFVFYKEKGNYGDEFGDFYNDKEY